MSKPIDLKQFVIRILRRASYRWPARNAAMKKARVSRGFYKCAECTKTFHRKEISLDHKEPVVSPTEGFIDWDTYIPRMFCDEDNFQVLCASCHDIKTSYENVIRKIKKKKLTRRKKQTKVKKEV